MTGRIKRIKPPSTYFEELAAKLERTPLGEMKPVFSKTVDFSK